MNPLPYDNLEVGIGPGYGGTPVLIRRGNTNTLTYTYATGFSINVEAGQKIYFNTYWYGGNPRWFQRSQQERHLHDPV